MAGVYIRIRHEIFTQTAPTRHTFPKRLSYSDNTMRGAFVVRLGPETKPSSGLFEGWVEDVDSGKEMRFHSVAELLGFFGQRFSDVSVTRSSAGSDAPLPEG